MKAPTPKLDALRAMRESNYEQSHRAPARKAVSALRAAVAAVPVKRAPKVKREVKP
jgi:hypothetical protein